MKLEVTRDQAGLMVSALRLYAQECFYTVGKSTSAVVRAASRRNAENALQLVDYLEAALNLGREE